MATITCIRIPSGRSIPVGQYAAAWKKLLSVDPSTSVPKWDHFDTDAGDVLQEMRSALHDRINRKDPRYPNGRKASYEYSVALLRMNQYIGNRVIMDWIDPVLGPRVAQLFAHRMRKNCCE